MPPVIAAIVPYIAGAVTAIGGGTFAAAAVGAAVASAFSVIANTLFLSAVMRALGPKRPKGSGRGIEQSGYDATMPGRLLFGQVKVGGAWVLPPLVTTDIDLGGANGGMRSHRIFALAIHEIDSFITTYADQNEITNAQIDAVTGSAYTDGRVNSGKYAPNGTSTTYMWIRRYTGTSTQVVDYFLSQVDGTAFSSNFRGRGIAYAAITYGWSGSASGYLWQQGLPDFTFTVKGMKCYDPRLDTTNGGSGSHRYATPSTWEWTDCPALIASTFLMFDQLRGGGGYDPATEIDWALVAAAANICDASVTIPSGSQARYTCNLVLDATALFEDNLGDIIDCMMGRCIWRDGKWRLYAGAWDTATFTIEESDWLSPVAIQTIAPRREGRWNGVRCFYVDPSRNYQRVEAYPRTSSTYYDDDAGERIWLELERSGVNTETEAQRHAEFILRQSRNQIRFTGLLGPKFQYLALWETGVINFASLGWSSKTFRLVSYRLNADGSVNVGFGEEQSTDWTDLASGEYSSPSIAALPESNVQAPDAPTALTITATISGTILASLTPGQVKPIGTTYQLYASPGSLWNANSAQLTWEGDAQTIYVPYSYGIPRWWHVRAHHGSYFSAFYPNTFGTAFMLLPPADNTFANHVVPDGDFSVGTPAYWTLDGLPVNGLTITYQTSMNGGAFGGMKWSKTSSDAIATQGQCYAMPHPAQQSPKGRGYPSVGRRTYSGYMRFRVNCYSNPGAGDFRLYPRLCRSTSQSYIDSTVLATCDAADSPAYYETLSRGISNAGSWTDWTFGFVAPENANATRFGDALGLWGGYPLGMYATNIDFDRCELIDVTGVNAPIFRGRTLATVNTLTRFAIYDLASEVRLAVGSVNLSIGSAQPWLGVGESVFFCKIGSTSQPNRILSDTTSHFLTLSGTTAYVSTVTLAAGATLSGKVTRIDSYHYQVSAGAGIS